LYKPDTKEQIWKSVNVSKFTAPPPATSGRQYDKRSCKADQFSIIHNASGDFETYTISANPADDLQIHLVVTREAAGYKFGNGPKGGFSYFGADTTKPDGYAVHRFWPRTKAAGHVIHKGRAIMAEGHGMFVHAIQGMRPNLVAASWNFADFQSDELGGISAIQMEYTTIDSYGRKGPGSGGVVVNLGSLVVGGKLISVSGETRWPDAREAAPEYISRAEHMDATLDPETGYKQPQQIKFSWTAPLIEGGDKISAFCLLDVGTPDTPRGLLQKVDVLAEIPYVIKKFVNYVAGTKPYIYQVIPPDFLRIVSDLPFFFSCRIFFYCTDFAVVESGVLDINRSRGSCAGREGRNPGNTIQRGHVHLVNVESSIFSVYIICPARLGCDTKRSQGQGHWRHSVLSSSC
jgi:hypothetical protein